MGGATTLVSSVLGVVGTLTGQRNDAAKQAEKERRRLKEEQRKKEAEARKRNRDKVMEARQLERKRSGGSTLSSGAASLVDDQAGDTPPLKEKLGE